MCDLVGNPEDRISQNEAHMIITGHVLARGGMDRCQTKTLPILENVGI